MDWELLSEIAQKLLLGTGGLLGTLKITSALAQFLTARAASFKTKVEAENSIKQQDFETYKKTVDTLQATVLAYAAQLDRVGTDCDKKMAKYQAQVDNLDAKLQERGKQLHTMATEMVHLRAELTLSNERIRQLEIELAKKNAQIEALQRENGELRQYPLHSRKGLATQ